MPPRSEFLADESAVAATRTPAACYGQRPASVLGVSLVLALALVTFLRWTDKPSAVLEKVVQQPIPADAAASAPRAELTAPDPGDSPP